MNLFNDEKIEVQAFGLVAETISSAQLEALGAGGYSLINTWALNEKDYGPNKHYFMFEQIDD